MDKKTKEKFDLARNLAWEVDDPLVMKFFDFKSTKLLDKKIKVLQERLNGKPPSEIPEYYDILELYPKDPYTLWD